MKVNNNSLNTTIENEFGVKVSTIEHLMGALFGLGIDNALIEIDNEEVPILDGSAKEFIEKIISSGLVVSESPIKIIKINKEIKFTDGERFISIEPSTLSLDIDFELKYKNPIIGNQKNKVKVFEDDLTDVYNSRTFCLFEDIELIKKNGLAKGGSLQNAIVVKDDEVLNPEGLRNDKEFVNHKILDCIGDLYTSGYRMIMISSGVNRNICLMSRRSWFTSMLSSAVGGRPATFTIVTFCTPMPGFIILLHSLRRAWLRWSSFPSHRSSGRKLRSLR